MNLKNLFFSVLALSPSLAVAHPGHETSALHLHVGIPSAMNSINPLMLAAGLFVGSLFLAASLFKSR
jgi:hypothetical protein